MLSFIIHYIPLKSPFFSTAAGELKETAIIFKVRFKNEIFMI
jgi:hypothetical protein